MFYFSIKNVLIIDNNNRSSVSKNDSISTFSSVFFKYCHGIRIGEFFGGLSHNFSKGEICINFTKNEDMNFTLLFCLVIINRT